MLDHIATPFLVYFRNLHTAFTSELIYEAETDSQIENRLVVAKWQRGGMDWELGISRYKLLHIKWINNGSYRISGNYMQYPEKKTQWKRKKKTHMIAKCILKLKMSKCKEKKRHDIGSLTDRLSRM